MADNNIKAKRGGARPGAGRPRKQEESKLYTFRALEGHIVDEVAKIAIISIKQTFN